MKYRLRRIQKQGVGGVQEYGEFTFKEGVNKAKQLLMAESEQDGDQVARGSCNGRTSFELVDCNGLPQLNYVYILDTGLETKRPLALKFH